MKFLPILLLCVLSFVHGYKILFLAPFPVPSHWFFLDPFIKELLTRGHQVTTVSNFKSTASSNNNLTELIITPQIDMEPISPEKWIFDGRYYNDFHNLALLWRVGLATTNHAFESKVVQNLLKSKDQYDLVISEQFQQESFLLFAHKFNAPLLTISTYDLTEYLDVSKGFRTPHSFIPHILMPYTDDMTYSERIYNFFISTVDKLIRQLYYLPSHNILARKYFQIAENDKEFPSVQEMESRIAVTLFNSHRGISPPRPQMPTHIQVGGVHIKPPKKLPHDIQQFLDEAEHGVILFAWGSHVKVSKMPEKKVQSFLKQFRRIKQRVLWKYEDTLDDVPKNVMLVKWLPQNDVLAHENVVLFINHGGVFGTQESTYHGVPMLSIPFYGDQFRNVYWVQHKGYGLVLEYDQINDDNVKEKLSELLTDSKYLTRAKEMAEIFRDNPIKPIDEAMYWIEYVAKYKGADYLQSKAIQMPFWKYYMLDVYGLIIVLFFTLATIAFIAMEKAIGKKKEQKKTKTSTKDSNRKKKE